jgi:hypothetical protein
LGIKRIKRYKKERKLQRDATYTGFGGVLYPERPEQVQLLGGKMHVGQANEML